MSDRNSYIIEKVSIMREIWIIPNYLFGGSEGANQARSLFTETDIFDIYFFFGFFSIVYLFYYSKMFFFKAKRHEDLIIYILFLIIAATGGHLFTSAVVPMYFMLYVFARKSIVVLNQTAST
jgi:hypothetical protein